MVHPASLVTIEPVIVEHIGELKVVVSAVRGEAVPADELAFGNRAVHRYAGLQVDMLIKESPPFSARPQD